MKAVCIVCQQPAVASMESQITFKHYPLCQECLDVFEASKHVLDDAAWDVLAKNYIIKPLVEEKR